MQNNEIPIKYPLSSNMIFFKKIIFIFLIANFIMDVSRFSKHNSLDSNNIKGSLFFYSLGLTLFFLIKKLKKITFNNDNFYLTGETIPFEQIVSINITMIDIGDADFYKIFYKDNSGKLTSVLFFPTEFFPYFKQLALEKNEKIKIKNSSNSFDF